MNYTFDDFAAAIRMTLAATDLIRADEVELSEPKPNIPADLGLACFKAAKARGVNPAQLAQQIVAAAHIAPDGLIGELTATGPFINVALRPALFAKSVLNDVAELGDQYGADDLGAGKTVLVEYSSPNVAKRMHVGHIRSTIIGQALNNIFGALGYRTISDNHLGDWGKQFGTNIAAIMKFGRPTGEGEAALAEIEKLYQEYNRLMKGRATRSRLTRRSVRRRPVWTTRHVPGR